MRKKSLVLAICAAMALATTAAVAQAKLDEFDLHASNLRLLEDKRVQKELGVTDAQRAKMNQHADAFRKQLDAYGKELQAKGQDPKAMKRPDAKMTAFMATLKRNAFGELQPAQLKRLREISLQVVGLVGVLDSKVAKRVGMTEPQVKKLRELYAAGSKTADALVKKEVGAALAPYKSKVAKTPEERKKLEAEAREKVVAVEKRIAPQVEKIRAETRTKMLAAMSKQQKDAYVALQGARFTPQA